MRASPVTTTGELATTQDMQTMLKSLQMQSFRGLKALVPPKLGPRDNCRGTPFNRGVGRALLIADHEPPKSNVWNNSTAKQRYRTLECSRWMQSAFSIRRLCHNHKTRIPTMRLNTFGEECLSPLRPPSCVSLSFEKAVLGPHRTIYALIKLPNNHDALPWR
jgi:hypothetical protein